MEDTTAPAPRMKGRFNLYDTPDGGLHISYQEDDTLLPEYDENPSAVIVHEVQHIDIPGQALNMMKMLESGKLSPTKALTMVTKMFGGR